MLNLNKIKAMKKIKEELSDLSANPIANIGVTIGLPDENNIFEWQCSLMGPKDTSYNGGLFFLKIKFPDDYPTKPPEVCFKTPIYHININPHKPKTQEKGAEGLGHVCISTLNWWKDTYTMREVLTNIFGLFYMANPDSPYGVERADEFRFDRAVYEEKVKYFTKKYAHPSVASKEYDSDWDFTFG